MRLKKLLVEIGEGSFGSYDVETEIEYTDQDFYIVKTFTTDNDVKYIVEIVGEGKLGGVNNVVSANFDVVNKDSDTNVERSLKDVSKIVKTVVEAVYQTYKKYEDRIGGIAFWDAQGEFDQEPNNVRERLYKKFIRKHFPSAKIKRETSRYYDGWLVVP